MLAINEINRYKLKYVEFDIRQIYNFKRYYYEICM